MNRARWSSLLVAFLISFGLLRPYPRAALGTNVGNLISDLLLIIFVFSLVGYLLYSGPVHIGGGSLLSPILFLLVSLFTASTISIFINTPFLFTYFIETIRYLRTLV